MPQFDTISAERMLKRAYGDDPKQQARDYFRDLPVCRYDPRRIERQAREEQRLAELERRAGRARWPRTFYFAAARWVDRLTRKRG